jgi:hypothetical protein
MRDNVGRVWAAPQLSPLGRCQVLEVLETQWT